MNRPNRNRGGFNLRGRMLLVGVTLGLCSVALVGRAAYVQLVNADFYQRQGDARFLREIPIPTSRGMITDRNGEPVAVSSPVESVWGNPQELLKAPDRLPELAQALGVPLDHLTNRLSQKADKEFLYLKRRINPDEAQKILAHKIPGVFSQREFRRFYPQGPAMAHVLGFTNIDDRGQEGLELAFDEWLSGTPGAQKVIRDNRGRIVENVDLIRSAQPGKDLTLSIDDTDGRLRPGMSAIARIAVGRMPDVLLVPAKAVFGIDGQNVVFVARRGTFERVPVTVIRRGRDQAAIDGAVREGDTIALARPDEAPSGAGK